MATNHVTQADAEWIELLDNLGSAALIDGDLPDCEYFWQAAESYGPLPDAAVTARMALLSAALGRKDG